MAEWLVTLTASKLSTTINVSTTEAKQSLNDPKRAQCIASRADQLDEEVKEQIRKNFYETYEKAKNIAKDKLKGHLNQLDYAAQLFDYLLQIVEDFSEKYILENPEDQEFSQEMEKFLINLARLRYQESPDLITKIRSFLFEIQNKYEKRKKSFEGFDELLERLNIIEEIISTNVHTLDLCLLLLCENYTAHPQDPTLSTAQISAISLQKSYEFLSRRLITNITWFLDVVTKDLEKHGEIPKRKTTGWRSKELLQAGIDALKQNILPLASRLILDRADHIAKYRPELDLLSSKLEQLCNANSHGVVPFAECERDRTTFTEELNQCLSENGVSLDKNNEIYLYDFISKKTVVVNLTLSELKAYISFLNTVQTTHFLFDTFVCRPMKQMHKISDVLERWKERHQRPALWKKILPHLSIEGIGGPGNEEPVSAEQSQADEWLNQMLTKKPKPKKGPQRNTQKKCAPVTVAVTEKKKKKRNAKNSVMQGDRSEPAPLTPVEWVEQALQHLEWTIRSESSQLNYYEKSALRQAVIAMNSSLQLAREMASSPQGSLRLAELIRDCYFLCEQTLRYEVLALAPKGAQPVDGDFSHDLEKKCARIEQADKIDRVAVEMFESGHLWPHSAHYLFSRWKQLEARQTHIQCPKILNWLMDSWNSGCENVNQERSIEVFNTAIKLIKTLRVFKELSPKDLQRSGVTFRYQVKWNSEKQKILSNQLNNSLKGTSLSSNHPGILKLKQAHQALLLIEFSAKKLEVPSISPEQFSHEIRNIIYWLQNAMENALQGMICIHTGRVTHSHDLVGLYQEIIKGEDGATRDFLNEYFNHLYKDCRYPFDNKKSRSVLHALFLAAEVLRESPELLGDFQRIGQTTALNFIEVDQAWLSPTKILNEINRTCEQSFKLLQEMILALDSK